ncbi:MAG: heme A synthase [Piscinibacter sp.]|uniref:COX15/CtaA family protein n=1 Tax=Piscinibacter sp. TaxID=1903157 RepID=UPI003D128515
MDAQPLYDLTPVLRLALLGLVLALGPLAWVWLRHRDASPAKRLRALTLLTLFLTFDLVVFGAFTRLSDSGLGCPDWPGCYGSASPLGAREEIHAEQSVRPSGPVTHGKAWVEMIHRYLAMSVGVLIIVMTVASWREARQGHSGVSPWWATAALVWVCAQGAFGALTVTMKLYPAIVTLHLLGGIGLLALLAVIAEVQSPRPLAVSPGVRRGVQAVAALAVLQVALGGWVSTNYAVLACQEFPTCQGSWWPAMDFRHGFTLLRDLGETKQGDYLPFAALTAIHYTHRLAAYVVLAAMLVLGWTLHRSGEAGTRRLAVALLVLALWQLASGLSNVVLGWPLLAALAHTAGAAALIALLAVAVARSALAGSTGRVGARATRPVRAML